MNRKDLERYMKIIDDLLASILEDIDYIQDEDNHFIVNCAVNHLQKSYEEFENIYPESLPE